MRRPPLRLAAHRDLHWNLVLAPPPSLVGPLVGWAFGQPLVPSSALVWPLYLFQVLVAQVSAAGLDLTLEFAALLLV